MNISRKCPTNLGRRYNIGEHPRSHFSVIIYGYCKLSFIKVSWLWFRVSVCCWRRLFTHILGFNSRLDVYHQWHILKMGVQIIVYLRAFNNEGLRLLACYLLEHSVCWHLQTWLERGWEHAVILQDRVKLLTWNNAAVLLVSISCNLACFASLLYLTIFQVWHYVFNPFLKLFLFHFDLFGQSELRLKNRVVLSWRWGQMGVV